MKPFNLEEAKAGKPVVTRDGRKVRIKCFDRKSIGNTYPIVALVDRDHGEECFGYTINGKFTDVVNYKHHNDYKHPNDLFMATEKKEYWVNVYRHGSKVWTGSSTHETESSAIENRIYEASKVFWLKTIKIHEEEI